MGEKNDTRKWFCQTELYRNFFKKIIPVTTNRHSYTYHKAITLQNNKSTSDIFFSGYRLFFNSKNFLTHTHNSNGIHHVYYYNDDFYRIFDKNNSSSTSPVETL
ncbi:hypothetical protein IWQ47_000836 [Aquimarina sp. EL_43]|uniref:hypothetical protein n=1 Tax=Aquimarina TaxID=290174 RepID=UPI0004B33D61|nr:MULTISPECIES: hypothetical protein [Aquimarina]MBG6129862.1 hypothetical protein [Aquimarina sp. EL_35]MBG6150927.1 hypothetical protein [Aquimarina sp. EL_32]MBG6167766.1 hypothetical protein [Aquimarina sp. EL_43]